MKTLIIDLETIPVVGNYDFLTEREKAIFEKRYKVAKSKEAGDVFLEKASLDSEFSSIFCVCAILVNQHKDYKHVDDYIFRENQMNDLFDFLNKISLEERVTFAGHNIRNFDIPMLIRYAFSKGINISKIHDFKAIMQGNKVSMRDTMEMFSGGVWGYRISLDALCYALSVPTSKTTIDGGSVYEFVKAGKGEEVINYCMADCWAVYNILEKYNQVVL